MPPHMLFLLERVFPLIFVAAFGACVGSLINVLAYRLPLGMSVVLPASRCPACQTKLTWRENIPVLGWILLRGKCRFCRSPISREYPIVEASVAAIFVLFVALWFTVPNQWGPGPLWLGIDWKQAQPEWASNGIALMWPQMALVLILVSCLVAMTIIDAKTYTIPLVLPWTAALAGLVIHPLFALYVQKAKGSLEKLIPDFPWTIPTTTTYPALGAAIGGIAGLGMALLMMRLGLIRRSFADYEDWEKGALAKQAAERAAATVTGVPGPLAGDDPTHLWTAYPHARREMVRELAFLAPAAVLAYAGWMLFSWIWPSPAPLNLPQGVVGFVLNPHFVPLWAQALGGALLGYLVGGGIVWAVRILGSAGFGKEAMGMGDVHLLAAVGACLGWIDAVLAFFGAAFVGVGWAILGVIAGGRVKRTMPYGPFLAIATILVLLLKPLME